MSGQPRPSANGLNRRGGQDGSTTPMPKGSAKRSGGGALWDSAEIGVKVTKRPVCSYSYRSIDGIERFQKIRWALDPAVNGRTKTFTYRHRRPDTEYAWDLGQPPEWRHLLYNLPEVYDAMCHSAPILWTEGEKDADAAVRAFGITATSHSDGASVQERQATWLCGFQGDIILAYDVDPDTETGGNVGIANVIQRRRLLVRDMGIPPGQITIARAKAGKDVSDHIDAGYGLDDLVFVETASEMRHLIEVAARTTRLFKSRYMEGR